VEPAWLASKLTKRPCVVHIRQQIEPVKIKKYWLKKPDILIAVSQEIREVVIAAGVKDDRIMVAHSGIDISQGVRKIDRMNVRSLYSLDPTQPVIGTVAHLFPRKGYEFLIEALEGVKKHFPDIHLLIVGDGDKDYRSKLVTIGRRLGLERSITFVGFQRQVFDYISVFDIFVLPSVLEGFGIVLLEAMALEKPIVASRVGGIPDIVKDGVSGLLVPPRDSVALASALIQLLHDRDRRLKMGRAGRHRLEQHFTLGGMVKVIQDIYAGLLPFNHIVARS